MQKCVGKIQFVAIEQRDFVNEGRGFHGITDFLSYGASNPMKLDELCNGSGVDVN
jgi:hypothetical protein